MPCCINTYINRNTFYMQIGRYLLNNCMVTVNNICIILILFKIKICTPYNKIYQTHRALYNYTGTWLNTVCIIIYAVQCLRFECSLLLYYKRKLWLKFDVLYYYWLFALRAWVAHDVHINTNCLDTWLDFF